MDALREFLIRTPFFGGLDEPSLEFIVGMLVERQFAAGKMVYREGELGRSMYVVVEGEVLVCRTGESGRLIRLMHLGPGDFFGETTLIEMQPRTNTVMTVSGARLFELTNTNLFALYNKSVEAYVMVLQNINRELCRRLRTADTRITEVAEQSEEEVTQIRRVRG